MEKLLWAYARWFPVSKGKYRLVERLGRGDAGKSDFIRQARLIYGGYTMECDLRKMLQRQFYFFGTYFLEERVLANWGDQAKNASVVFDIGANSGIYSLAAAASNPAALIHAFEATSDIAEHLEGTLARNHLVERISLHRCAVARMTGTAYLNYCSDGGGDNEGMNFVTNQARNSQSIAVPTVCLDEFCAQQGISTVDLVKIDVQGNEPEVLAGAEGLIRRGALRTIFFELNWNHDEPEKCSVLKTVGILSDAGYRFADPNAKLRFREAGSWLNGLSDVVAMAEAPSYLERIKLIAKEGDVR